MSYKIKYVGFKFKETPMQFLHFTDSEKNQHFAALALINSMVN